MPQGIIRQAEQYGLDVPPPAHHGMTEAQVADMLRSPRIHQGTMDRRPIPNEPDLPTETVHEPPWGWDKDFGDMEEYPPGSGQKWPKKSRVSRETFERD